MPIIAMIGCVIFLALSYQKYCWYRHLKTECQNLQPVISNLQKKAQDINLIELKNQIARLQAYHTPYQSLVQSYPNILQVIHDLRFDDSILVAQISCTLIAQQHQGSQHSKECLRVLLECQVNPSHQTHVPQDTIFENYVEYLKQKLNPVSITFSYEEPPVLAENFSDHFPKKTSRCLIQMDLNL